MNTAGRIAICLMVASLCVWSVCESTYIDCSMECLFAAFRPSHICDCTNNLKLHWGKRAPRARSHPLPTFRYGKRATPITYDVNNDVDNDRLNTLRLIKQSLDSDYGYDI